jgi:hypothetical protein
VPLHLRHAVRRGSVSTLIPVSVGECSGTDTGPQG